MKKNDGDEVSNIVMLYMTAANKDEAQKIGRVLVEKRLAACVNLWDGMQSLYWWEGKIDSANEAVLIAKTTRDKVNALITEVKKNHSYSVPCVLEIPVLSGNPDYLAWLKSSLS